MQEYKFQEEVRFKAGALVIELVNNGFKAELLEHTFRDYCAKISVIRGGNTYGNIIVYYKQVSFVHNKLNYFYTKVPKEKLLHLKPSPCQMYLQMLDQFLN